jgi:hypothetical protein
MYHWFKEARRAPGGDEMGGFTRILHSGKPDEFVDEIPTFVADPLPDGDQVLLLFASRNGKVSHVSLLPMLSLWFAVAGNLELWTNLTVQIIRNRENAYSHVSQGVKVRFRD